MGAFIISDISFKTQKDRTRFETKYKFAKVLVDANCNSYGFGAWRFTRNPTVDIIYYLGFLGYAEPAMMLTDCLKDGIGIKFWSWLPINDRRANWEKIRGRW